MNILSNNRFNHAEELLLKQMKGSKLLTIDAVLAAPPDNSWNTVRLHFEGFDIDVNNFLNNKYYSNVWVARVDDQSTGERVVSEGVYPQAPANFMFGVTYSF